MKQILTISLALAIAVPILAQEAKKADPPAPETKAASTAKTDREQPAAVTTTQVAEATEPEPTDSPLVAAAKRAHRLGRKPENVITNDTLTKVSDNVHVSEATGDAYVPVPIPPPHPTPEMRAHAAEDAARQEQADIDAQKQAEQDAAAQRASLLAAGG